MIGLFRKLFGFKMTVSELRAKEQSLQTKLENIENKIHKYNFIAGRAISENDRPSAESAWNKNKKLKVQASEITQQLVKIRNQIEQSSRESMLDKPKENMEHVNLESNLTLTKSESNNKVLNEVRQVVDFMLDQTQSESSCNTSTTTNNPKLQSESPCATVSGENANDTNQSNEAAVRMDLATQQLSNLKLVEKPDFQEQNENQMISSSSVNDDVQMIENYF